MSEALLKYKALVDKLKDLEPTSSESEVNSIDEQLKEAWTNLCDAERAEAEMYWRSSITTKTSRPVGLN